MNNIFEHLVCFDDARQFLTEQKDPKVREMLDYGFTTLVGSIGVQDGALPSAPFDCLYFLRVLAGVFRDPERIRQYLNGEISSLGTSESDLPFFRSETDESE